MNPARGENTHTRGEQNQRVVPLDKIPLGENSGRVPLGFFRPVRFIVGTPLRNPGESCDSKKTKDIDFLINMIAIPGWLKGNLPGRLFTENIKRFHRPECNKRVLY